MSGEDISIKKILLSIQKDLSEIKSNQRDRWSRSFRQPPTVFKWFAAPVLIPHPSFSVYSNKPRQGSCRLGPDEAAACYSDQRTL